MQEGNPYAAPQAVVEQQEAPDELRLGGRGERLGAVFIDGLIGMAIFAPLMIATGFWRTYMTAIMSGGWSTAWMAAGVALAGFALFLLVQGYPLATAGQTWGKRLLKLRIVDMQGRKPEFIRLVALRYLVGRVIALVPVVGGFYSFADALLIFRADKRCLHDLIAGTQVVIAD